MEGQPYGTGGAATAPRLSVVLATYNGERYLQQQLDSISEQTRPPDELVVGDDGSDDSTLQILERFQQKAPFPVTVARRQQTGIVSNFMLSVGDAHGDVVAFSDQDDVWLPEKLELCLAAMCRYDADVVVHGLQPVASDLGPTRATHRNVRRPVVQERLTANVWGQVSGNALVFRRRVLDGCDWSSLPPPQMARHPFYHDELVRLLGAVRGRTVRIPERLVLYRQHGANAAGAGQTLMEGRRHDDDHVTSLEYRAEVARQWAVYFSALVGPDDRDITEAYLLGAAEMMSARAARLHEAPWRAMPSIGVAICRREYSSRERGGFGWRALLQDLYQFLRPARWARASGGEERVRERPPLLAERVEAAPATVPLVSGDGVPQQPGDELQ